MIASFCCDCEAGWRSLQCMKEHFGHWPFPPPPPPIVWPTGGLGGGYVMPDMGQSGTIVAGWEPFSDRYLTRHDVFTSTSDPTTNKDSTMTIDRYTGAVTYTGDTWGWNGIIGDNLDLAQWFNATTSTMNPGAQPIVNVWTPSQLDISWSNASPLDTRLVINLGSKYTLDQVDLDANGLLNDFAPGEVTDGHMGGMAFKVSATQFGYLRTILGHLYFDGSDLSGFSTFFNPDWGNIIYYTDLVDVVGQPWKKKITTAGATQPTLAAYAFWLPPDVGPADPASYRVFPSVIGQALKFTSWIPMAGNYTRTTYRRNRATGTVWASDVSHLTASAPQVQTLAPALDPGSDVWIVLTAGWTGTVNSSADMNTVTADANTMTADQT